MSWFTNLLNGNDTVKILAFFLAAWLISVILKFFTKRAIRLERFSNNHHISSQERQETLRGLISGTINLVAYLAATLLSLGIFIKPETLLWIVGLFSAAFGLGARPVISDYLSGLSYIFEDTFSVGEKIEIPGLVPIEGVIETIKLRSTSLRAPSGELYIVPNGEIRTVRNFSRGKFSIVRITIKVATHDLRKALSMLDTLSSEAVILLPNLIEPWQVISPEGVMGQHTELSLVAKAKFGKAAEMRPRLLSLIEEKLTETDIDLMA